MRRAKTTTTTNGGVWQDLINCGNKPSTTFHLFPRATHQLLGQVLGKGNDWDLLGGTLVTMELKQFAADKSVLFVVGKARRWGHYQNEFEHISNPFYAPIWGPLRGLKKWLGTFWSVKALAKNIRCLPPNEGKVIFPFSRWPPTTLRHLSQFDMVLAFDEERLNQVRRQRNNWGHRHSSSETQTIWCCSVLAGFPRRV